MAQVTLKYDARNTIARKTIEYILALGVFKVEEEESPYNPKFVEKIKESEKGKEHKIDIEDLWK